MAARDRAHPHGRALPSFAPREMLVQLRAVFAGKKATEKVGAKTGQGRAGVAGRVKAIEVKKEKKKADRARFSVPLRCSPPPGSCRS